MPTADPIASPEAGRSREAGAGRIDLGSARYGYGGRLKAIAMFSSTWEDFAERAAALFATPPSRSREARGALPCPFCGGVATVERLFASTWSAGCGDEGCKLNPFAGGESRAQALEAWNTRATPPAAAPTSPADRLREAARAKLARWVVAHAPGTVNWCPDSCPVIGAPSSGLAGPDDLTLGDLRALASAEADGGWLSAMTPPYGQEVEVRVGKMRFLAKLVLDGSVDAEGGTP